MRAGLATLRLLGGLVLAALVVACGGDDGDDDDARAGTTSSTATTDAASTTTAAGDTGALGDVRLALEEVARLDAPVDLVARSGTRDLYVASQWGVVQRIEVSADDDRDGDERDGDERDGDELRHRLVETPVLDLTDVIVEGAEQGLLGIEFSSDGQVLYASYSVQPDGDSLVAAFPMRGDRADRDGAVELLRIDQPYANHNGGGIRLGPDGYLYLSFGDGGSRADPEGNAQDLDVLLGKILRIDPDPALGGTAGGEGGQAYAIPAGNPFAEGGGRPEIWLYGVRNPWRFSFDAETGDLWVADVGQDAWEEVDWLPAGEEPAGRGANLGWDLVEGTHPFEGGANPDGGVLPVFEYSHDEGCSVTGGPVYRGEAVADLVGAYLFGDYCAPGLRAIRLEDGAVVAQRRFDLPIDGVRGFGTDHDGEVYVLSADGSVARLVAG